MKFAIFLSLLLSMQTPSVYAQTNNNAAKSKKAATANGQTKPKGPTPIDYQSYLDSVIKKIKTVWNPVENGVSGTAQVSFKIHKDGSVSDVIARSKLVGPKEKLIIAAIKKAAPFKSPPLDPKESSLDLKFSMDYATFTGSDPKPSK